MSLPTTINNNLDNYSKAISDGNNISLTDVGTKIRDNIQTIIRQMIETRLYTHSTPGGSSSDTVKRDTKFLKKLEKELITQISEYTKETNKLIDLDKILIDISEQLSVKNTSDNTPDGKKIHKNIVSDIANIIINDLNDIIKDKIQAKIIDCIKINDIGSLIEHIKEFLVKPYSSSVLDATISTFISNVSVRSIDDSRKKYRDTITDLYKKEVFDKIDERRIEEERLEKQKLPKSLNIFKNLNDSISERRATLLVNNIIYQINLGMTQKLRYIITNSFKFLVHIPNLIVKASVKGLKLVMTLTLIPLLFKVVGKFIIKPLMKIIIKPLSLIGGFMKKIFGNLIKVIKRVTLSKFLLTPIGIYSVGFILGFIWKKLKKILPFYNEDLSLIENIKILWNDILKVYGIIKNGIKEWIDKHPTISKTIQNIGEDFGTIIQAFKTGDVKAIKDTHTVQYIQHTIENIENSWWFAPIKLAYTSMSGIITTISQFIIDHPKLSLTLFGIAKTFLSLSPFFRFIGPIKGGIGKFMAGAFAAGILEHVVDSIFGAFQGRNDEGLTFWNENIKKMYDTKGQFFSDDVQTRLKNGLSSLDKNVKNKYNYLIGYLQNEQNIIINSKRVIDLLDNYYEASGTTLDKKVSKYLNNILLYIIGSDKSMTSNERLETIKKIKKYGINNYKSYRDSLVENLDRRTIYISNVYDYLSHLNIESIGTGLDNIIDDNFDLVKINMPIFTNKDGITIDKYYATKYNEITKKEANINTDDNDINIMMDQAKVKVDSIKNQAKIVLSPTDYGSKITYNTVKSKISQLNISDFKKEKMYAYIRKANSEQLKHINDTILDGGHEDTIEWKMDQYFTQAIAEQNKKEKDKDNIIENFRDIITRIQSNVSQINEKNKEAINNYIKKYDKIPTNVNNIFILQKIRNSIEQGIIYPEFTK